MNACKSSAPAIAETNPVEVCMTALKDYKRFTARCLEEARVTIDERHKAFLVEMAQAWQRLADEAANVKRLEGSSVASEPEPWRLKYSKCDGSPHLGPPFLWGLDKQASQPTLVREMCRNSLCKM